MWGLDKISRVILWSLEDKYVEYGVVMCHVITVIIRIISFRMVIRLTFTMASLLPFLFDFPKYLNNRSEHASWKRGVHSGKMTGFSRFWLIFRLNKN